MQAAIAQPVVQPLQQQQAVQAAAAAAAGPGSNAGMGVPGGAGSEDQSPLGSFLPSFLRPVGQQEDSNERRGGNGGGFGPDDLLDLLIG